MASKWTALGAGALALIVVAGTFDAAEARRGFGGFRAGGGGGFAVRSYSGRAFAPSRFVARPAFAAGHWRHHGHRRFGRAVLIGAPLAFGAYSYGYSYGRCAWLRHRAIETGSRYWWSRYYDCVEGYY